MITVKSKELQKTIMQKQKIAENEITITDIANSLHDLIKTKHPNFDDELLAQDMMLLFKTENIKTNYIDNLYYSRLYDTYNITIKDNTCAIKN